MFVFAIKFNTEAYFAPVSFKFHIMKLNVSK